MLTRRPSSGRGFPNSTPSLTGQSPGRGIIIPDCIRANGHNMSQVSIFTDRVIPFNPSLSNVASSHTCFTRFYRVLVTRSTSFGFGPVVQDGSQKRVVARAGDKAQYSCLPVTWPRQGACTNLTAGLSL